MIDFFCVNNFDFIYSEFFLLFRLDICKDFVVFFNDIWFIFDDIIIIFSECFDFVNWFYIFVCFSIFMNRMVSSGCIKCILYFLRDNKIDKFFGIFYIFSFFNDSSISR